MQRISLFFIVFLTLIPFYTTTAARIPNNFTDKITDQNILDLFTFNAAVLKFKKSGEINNIKNYDIDLLANILTDELKSVSEIKPDLKLILLKGLNYVSAKNQQLSKVLLSDTDAGIKSGRSLIYNQKDNIKMIKQNIDAVLKDTKYSRLWVENLENDYFTIKTADPIDRTNGTNYSISKEKSVDYLFSGEIELYYNQLLITIDVYSSLADRVIYSKSFTSTEETMSDDIRNLCSEVFPSVFNINYSRLSVSTVEGGEIYINDLYTGTTESNFNYVKPDTYSATVKVKEKKDSHKNIIVKSGKHEVISIKAGEPIPLQKVSFDIEPYGTKIFINSSYRGKTPFSEYMPAGNYVLEAKPSSLYISKRYTFNIEEIADQEKIITFHLLTKSIDKFLVTKKYLYYAAFWSFTFSLAAFVPVTVMSVDYYNRLGIAASSYNDLNESNTAFVDTVEGKKLYYTSEILRYTAIGLGIHCVLNVAWLFYSLSDYIKTLDKKDFIPIIEFRSGENGKEELQIGAKIPLG